MSYTPNLDNAMVRRRIKNSLNWVNTYLSINNDRWLSTREIQRQFGSQSRPLGQWIKSRLLICVDSYYSSLNSRCKTYRLNLNGYTEICNLLDYAPKFKPSQQIEHQIASGEFEYKTLSNRDFNPVQFIPKAKRRSILENHGYRYHYDIQASAPTLLLQRAHQLGSTLSTPALDEYINNKSIIRQTIANQCQCGPKDIKLVINAVLQGAVISKYWNNSILKELNNDYDLITRLQNNQMLKDIRTDIKKCWSVLKEDIPVRYLIDRNGKQRRRALTGGDKSSYYRFLEESVGKVIRKFLKKERNRHLWIHDGWSCKKIVDDIELIAEVRRQTAFVIKLDRELFDQ